MDAGNLIYIIAIVVYFIYSALKKSQKNKQLGEKEVDKELPSEPQRPVSFEDLLREIREGQREREKDLSHTGQGDVASHVPQNVKPVAPTRPDRKEFEPQRTIMRSDQPAHKKFEDYEGALPEREVPKRKRLDDEVRLTSKLEGLKSELFSESRRKSKPTNRYAELLRNPTTVKDAVILSEILNRKYS